MKKRIQVTIDIEYDDSLNPEKKLTNDIDVNLRNILSEASFVEEIALWDMRITAADPDKHMTQFTAERKSEFFSIQAYASSDGPAVGIHLDNPETLRDAQVSEFFNSELNGALREAYHKYLAHLRDG